MNFQDLEKVENGEFYLEKAFRKSKGDLKDFKDCVCKDLYEIIKDFPNFDKMDRFYREMTENEIGIDKIKKELGRLKGIRKRTILIYRDYSNRLKNVKGEKAGRIKKEFYGKISSLIRKGGFEFLEESRKKMKKFPAVKTKIYTVCITGFPNVGKSTLLKKLTGAKAEIRDYAFTTKGLNVGYINKEIQLIDTPGSLDRVGKMNEIEKKAYLAMNYLANCIVYVFDASEECGYGIEEQKKLFRKIKGYDKRVIAYFSKEDIIGKEKIMGVGIKGYSDCDKLKKHLLTLRP